MRITASKREDILRRKSEYEANRAASRAKFEEQFNAYSTAEDNIFEAVKSNVMQLLKGFDLLEFDVSVDRRFRSHLGVSIRCNDRKHSDPNSSLTWSYDVILTKDGEVQKETSSWSGLQATTESQLASLTQTLEALKQLNKIDWATLLNVTLPKYSDYVTEPFAEYDRNAPDFDRELIEADIEEAIGTNVLIKGQPDSGRYTWGNIYYGVVSNTPAMYTVFEVSGRYVDAILRGELLERPEGRGGDVTDISQLIADSKSHTYKIRKDTFINHKAQQPIQTLEY